MWLGHHHHHEYHHYLSHLYHHHQPVHFLDMNKYFHHDLCLIHFLPQPVYLAIVYTEVHILLYHTADHRQRTILIQTFPIPK